MKRRAFCGALAVAGVAPGTRGLVVAAPRERRLLYVATPGLPNASGAHGGVGLVVFDVDAGHRACKRIPTFELAPGESPEAIKGIAASAQTRKLYLTTPKRLMVLDLVTERALWVKTYPGGCDRLAISPDGKILYVPSYEGPHWHAVDASTGEILRHIETGAGAHNTIFGPGGDRVYLAGLKSPWLSVADARTHEVVRTVGPFSAVIRPFTINGSETLGFMNVNRLLGFEVGDLRTGKVLHRVEVQGFSPGAGGNHGCPSHGIALTPDERELWLTDTANSRLHVFDARVMPPKQIASIGLRERPGWVTLGLDGRHAYPSSGDVIDTRTRQVVTGLTDETRQPVQSEKLLEIAFTGAKPVRAGSQFGIGSRRRSRIG